MLTLAALPLLLSSVPADWPQWRGPKRDGISTETGLLQSWPESGPPLVWKATGLGGGYTAPAIGGGSIYGAGYRGEDEVVWALDEKDGTERWSTRVAAAYREMEYDEGPRATPTLDGGQLFMLGAAGNLVCLDAASGEVSWSVDIREDLGGRMMSDWGYSESPLVDGDHVICTPGGDGGAVAAFDRKTGKLAWRSEELTDVASYASLVPIELGGRKQYVVLTGLSVAGVAAEDGDLLWRAERRGKTAVVPTPIYCDSHVWVTSGYGVGCSLVEIKAEGDGFAAGVAYSNRTIKNDQGGAIRSGDHVYATSGPLLICMDWRTGELVWRERTLPRAALVCADGHLYVRGERGRVALVEVNAEEYVEKGNFEQTDRSEAKSWPHPVVCGGKLYLRDQDVLLCYDVRAGE